MRWTRSHWRAATLIGVHVAAAVHITWWFATRRVLAPAELNESMFTLEHGVITVGFILMALIVLSVAVFGRFFCSWGCHVLAMQDGAAWVLERWGIRPKPVRLRFLLLVPVFAAAYMFLWPQVTRIQAGREWGPLRVSSDAEGFGSLVTSDFFRNLPSITVTIVTFLTCAGLMVYLLGTRSFCTYVCPYGAVFSLTDRIAPGRIRLTSGTDQCAQCARCTAVCTSHIRVHDEVARFGRVVSPACLKDLDCVDACPTGALQFGFTRPSGFLSWRKWGRFGISYDASMTEELVAAAVFLIVLTVTRGLYGIVPFFLAMALGAIAAWGSIVAMRLIRRRDVRWGHCSLKRAGTITPAGCIVIAMMVGAIVCIADGALVRVFMRDGVAAWDRGDLRASREAFDAAEGLALCHWDDIDLPRAQVMLEQGDVAAARVVIARIVARDPTREGWKAALDAIEPR